MKKSSLILALAIAMSAWSATAQPSGDPPDQAADAPQQGRHRPHPDSVLIKALDANGDGIIDAAEIANAPVALLKLDKNGDGQLTRDEFLPPRPGGGTNGPPPGFGGTNGAPGGRGGHRPPPPPIIAALDVNGDGIIDAKEIANASAELLTLDKNGDGQLTPDEWRPHRPPPGDGGGDGMGPDDAGGPPKGPPPDE